MTIDRLDKIDDYPDHDPKTALLVTVYEHISEDELVFRGCPRSEAFAEVRNRIRADRDVFTTEAVDFNAYRRKITDTNEGIPIEYFTRALGFNPTQVLADAKHWAAIHKNATEPAATKN